MKNKLLMLSILALAGIGASYADGGLFENSNSDMELQKNAAQTQIQDKDSALDKSDDKESLKDHFKNDKDDDDNNNRRKARILRPRAGMFKLIN